jgi:hypothetical protein
MFSRLWLAITLCALADPASTVGQQLVNGRKSLVFEGRSARLVVDLAGGSIGEFRFLDAELNPLNWATPKTGQTNARGFGHFLCLDRWGPPSEAEGAKGMPYHGEAANVEWQVLRSPAVEGNVLISAMEAKLPMAGFSVKRTITFSVGNPIFAVREEIKNENRLGRIYNMVQHPTIGPPFLDESTLVDCNGRKGFAQGTPLPDPQEPSFYWPRALNREGQEVNLRRLASDPNPNVVSYMIEEDYGWVTAVTPKSGLLVGYVWKTRDYPWISLWRDVQNGKPSARGLEFGTTGLHQPYPILVRKARIFDRQLFEHLDADEIATKTYLTFLLKVPTDFTGVESIHVEKAGLVVRERAGKRAEHKLDTTGLW